MDAKIEHFSFIQGNNDAFFDFLQGNIGLKFVFLQGNVIFSPISGTKQKKYVNVQMICCLLAQRVSTFAE